MEALQMKITYDRSETTWHFVRSILACARAAGKHEAVANCLVGSKLQLRFPGLSIDNKSVDDDSRGYRQFGKFRIGETVFHIAAAPSLLFYEECRSNINAGLKVYLLVSEASVVGARQNSEDISAAKITVISIEAFVSQNIDEISQFDPQEQRSQLAALLALYNERVDAVESDKSLMIEIPSTLLNQ